MTTIHMDDLEQFDAVALTQHDADANLKYLTASTRREVVAIFDSYDDLCAAARALRTAGFAHWNVMRDAARAVPNRMASEIAEDPDAPRTESVEIEALHHAAGYVIGTCAVIPGIVAAWGSAAGGLDMTVTLGSVLLIGGGSAVVGALIAAVMARFQRAHLVARARRNGLVLWAYALAPEQEAAAVEIMAEFGGRRVAARPAHG